MHKEAHEESLGVPVRVGVKGLIITVHDGVKVLLTLGDSLLDAVKEAELLPTSTQPQLYGLLGQLHYLA